MALPVGKSIHGAGGERIEVLFHCMGDLPVKSLSSTNPYPRDHRAKTHPMVSKRHFYLKHIVAEFAPSSWIILHAPYLPILAYGITSAPLFRQRRTE